MSDVKLNGVANVMLGATDLDRSVAFYHGILGLDLQFQTEGFAFLDGGGVTLALSTAHATLATPVAGGTEIVFGVDDVTAAHAALIERGVEFMNAPRNVTGDRWAASFRDPDGHLLSVFGPEKA
jgi:glyoxylase I family protein